MKLPAGLEGVPPSAQQQGMEGRMPRGQRKARCIGRKTGSTLLTTSRLLEQQGIPVCQVRWARHRELCNQIMNHPNALR